MNRPRQQPTVFPRQELFVSLDGEVQKEVTRRRWRRVRRVTLTFRETDHGW